MPTSLDPPLLVTTTLEMVPQTHRGNTIWNQTPVLEINTMWRQFDVIWVFLLRIFNWLNFNLHDLHQILTFKVVIFLIATIILGTLYLESELLHCLTFTWIYNNFRSYVGQGHFKVAWGPRYLHVYETAMT